MAERQPPTRYGKARVPICTSICGATIAFVTAESTAGLAQSMEEVLKVAEQTLKVEHGSELRANALEPHQ
jgi:hypothetical protein